MAQAVQTLDISPVGRVVGDYPIEGQTLELGVGLSEPVERAVAQVVELLLARLRPA